MRTRLDQALVTRGLADSRERARRMVLAGRVTVDGRPADKPSRKVDESAAIEVAGTDCPFVSRGGLKLAGALDRLGLTDLGGLTALDIGASTGGFTDCLLRRGARRVRAIDAGTDQLHASLLTDPRVNSREQANARELTCDWLDGERVDVVVADVSFISLRLILPRVPDVLAPGGWALPMVKPQFEAGRADLSRGGVVRDPAVTRRVLIELINFCLASDWRILGVCPSPITGPSGNREFFLWLDRGGDRTALSAPERDIAIEAALREAYNLD